MTIIEMVRSWKEQNAAESDFDIDRIIAAAREREARTQERLLDPPTRQTEIKPMESNGWPRLARLEFE